MASSATRIAPTQIIDLRRGFLYAVVPRVGLEPTQPIGQGILSPSCLPFHHLGDHITHTIGVRIRLQK